MNGVNGVHHITAIAGPAQENLDFYAGILGMRLVKKSVNQDDPGTYHLFYADAAGSPGTDLTFFPWPTMRQPRRGHGLTSEVGLEIPHGSLSWWADRLRGYQVAIGDPVTRFGDPVLPLTDPHGLELALIESPADRPRAFEPWKGGPVGPDRQIRGLHGARAIERDAGATVNFLTTVLGFERLGSEDGWIRFGFPSAPGVLDLMERTDLPRGAWGVGAVHHLAWRVDDETHERAVRQRVADSGGRPTEIIDRFWFRSVYFLEPGGVLFEIATDGPGFGIDEDAAHLGEKLVLPPFLEGQRAEIERALPDLKAPSVV